MVDKIIWNSKDVADYKTWLVLQNIKNFLSSGFDWFSDTLSTCPD